MPTSVATALNVSRNKLTGGIPASWANRNAFGVVQPGTGWNNLNVSFNSYMCGAPPTWFASRFPAYAQLVTGKIQRKQQPMLACSKGQCLLAH